MEDLPERKVTFEDGVIMDEEGDVNNDREENTESETTKSKRQQIMSYFSGNLKPLFHNLQLFLLKLFFR